MPIKRELDRLTVAQAEKDESSSLYVLNKSNPKGNINFVVRDSVGNSISIQIPVTFIPFDLSTLSVKADVLRTPAFRRLEAKSWIHIIETKSAEEMLKEPKAQAEFRRLNDVLEDQENINFQTPVSESVNAEPPEAEDNISTFVQNIVLRIESEPVESLLVELENKLDTLEAADIEYLSNNTSDDKVKAWCAEAMDAIA